MNKLDWRVQAAHFDHSAPVVPAADLLRRTGFRYSYSIKDTILCDSLDALEINQEHEILDAGCGLGIMLDRISAEYKSTGFGVDVSQKSLERANREGISGFALASADARSLPLADNSFEHVLSFDVLEHIQDPASAVIELVRALKPGGSILIYAVGRNNRFTFNWFLHKLLLPIGIDPSSRTCHSNELLVDPTEIVSILEDAGCQINSVEYIHSFFTLLFDQVLLSLLWMFSKIKPNSAGSIASESPGPGMLRLATSLSRAARGLLSRMDRPWTNRGISNGFLVGATKQFVTDRANQSLSTNGRMETVIAERIGAS